MRDRDAQLDERSLMHDGHLIPAKPLPAPLAEAVVDVARAVGLRPDWLNAGPSSLLDLGLPEGFVGRLRTRDYGSLILHIAGRSDHIAFKLYAAIDQGPTSKHTADLRALGATHDELLAAARWARTHDPSEGFRSQLVQALVYFGVADDVDV